MLEPPILLLASLNALAINLPVSARTQLCAANSVEPVVGEQGTFIIVASTEDQVNVNPWE